jgi:uncharacterized protein (DUF849 family)
MASSAKMGAAEAVSPRWLKACLNGGRQPSGHPAVPRTPAELAAAAGEAVRAGAQALHLHPRAADGSESLLTADVGAAVAAVRRRTPATPVGVSTGLWITGGDVGRRQALVASWATLDLRQRPDFASVNLSEPGSAELLGALDAAGIGAEAGVWSVADARLLAETTASGVNWLRVLVEILDVPAAEAVEAADRVLSAVHQADFGPGAGRPPVLLHGEGEACWPLVHHAGRLALATRIGLEDTVVGPHGEPVRDNAQLVRLGAASWSAGRAEAGR